MNLQADTNWLKSQCEISAYLKDFAYIKETLYATVEGIAKEYNIDVGSLWEWTVKEIISIKAKPLEVVVVEKSKRRMVVAKEPKVAMPMSIEPKVIAPIEPKVAKVPKVAKAIIPIEPKRIEPKAPIELKTIIPIEPKAPKAIKKPPKQEAVLPILAIKKPNGHLVDKSADELRYIQACKSKDTGHTARLLTQIEDVKYWRMFYKQTNIKDLKIFMNFVCTDFEIAEEGLRSSDCDIRYAVFKMVHRYVYSDQKVWDDDGNNLLPLLAKPHGKIEFASLN